MVAVPFTGTMIFRGKNGRALHVRCTMNDATTVAWVLPDASTTLQLPADTDWSLVDVIIVTGGTDTTQTQLYVNQLNTGLAIDHKSNLNTSQFRQFITNPVTFRAGSQLKMIQIT